MINLIRVLALCLITFTLSAQSLQSNEVAFDEISSIGVFKFQSDVLDYGTIKQNSDGNRSFTFKNTGNSPIIISKVKGSCGCTVATKPNQPIMPGETAKIGVKYDTKRVGAFSKSITVSSNASETAKIIRIKGVVLKNELSKTASKAIASSK